MTRRRCSRRIDRVSRTIARQRRLVPLARLDARPALRTVLFTDIVGHTEMMQRLGDAKGRDVLREHERITRETLKAHGGAEVKTMGDGFMASFGSVTSAMECAIALQRAFAAHTESMPEPLHVRVGLNAGEPIEEDGDLFGATVKVETVLGAVEAGALGVMLSHEHVLVDMGEDMRHYPWLYDLEATRAQAIREVGEAKAGGIDTIIDLTTPDLGRNVEYVRSVAEATGMHIVVATGIWRDMPRSFWARDLDRIADIFVREIEVGIGETAIKAGVIKVANDAEGVTPEGERVLRGAARASKRTGCPISTHHCGAGAGRHAADRDLPRRRRADGRRSASATAPTRRTSTYLESLLNEGRVPLDGPLSGGGAAAGMAGAQRDGEGAGRSRVGAPADAGARPRAVSGAGVAVGDAGERRAYAVPLRDDDGGAGAACETACRRDDDRRDDARGAAAVSGGGDVVSDRPVASIGIGGRPRGLIACDLDGTLLRSDESVSARTVAAIRRVTEAGWVFAMVTARPARRVASIAEDTGLGGLALCSNGAIVFDIEERVMVEGHAIEPAVAGALVTELREAIGGVSFGFEIGLQFAREEAYAYRNRALPPEAFGEERVGDALELAASPVHKLIVAHGQREFDALLDDVTSVVARRAEVTHSAREFVEVSARGVDKASGVRMLAERLGLEAADVVAIGDMPNDLPMLSWAGRAVAVANAHPDVIRAADQVAATNDSDGVADVLDGLVREIAAVRGTT